MLQVTLTAVDLDPAMVRVAQEWFGFQPDARLKVQIEDGINYIHEAAKDGEKNDRLYFLFFLTVFDIFMLFM